MKIRKFFPAVCFLLGILLLAGTAMLGFWSRNGSAQLLGDMPQAEARTEDWAQALSRGDYAAAGKAMYGQPELAPDRASDYAVGNILWEAFRERLEVTLSGELYATRTGIARNVTITALDIPAVMTCLKDGIDPLLARRAEATEDKDTVLDENNAYREEFVMEVLCEAARELLAQQDFTVQRNVTLQLICEDGQWWILPEQELIQILSGKLGKGD